MRLDMTDFIEYTKELIKKEVKRELKGGGGFADNVRFGTVVDATGRPQIRFDRDGDDAPTTRRYPYASSYTPVVGHRVILIKGGGTWVVVCRVV